MNILLTNDDGYTSKGLWELVRQLKDKNKLTVIAPEHEMSGASHSVSFFSGITYREIDCAPFLDGTFFDGDFKKNLNKHFGKNIRNTDENNGDFVCKNNIKSSEIRCFAVDGTPADCVVFGIRYLLKDEKTDLVVSGVNNVLNVGSDYMYSGTVGAAQEGTYLRKKAIALSLDARDDDFYDTCRFFADNLEDLTSDGAIPENVTLNINVPYGDFSRIKGVKATNIAYRPYDETYKPEKSGNGDEKYFISGYPYEQKDSGGEHDGAYIENGYITIVPIRLMATDTDALAALNKVKFKLGTSTGSAKAEL